jgi:hypothetical protein
MATAVLYEEDISLPADQSDHVFGEAKESGDH